jgi:hypothetical protein
MLCMAFVPTAPCQQSRGLAVDDLRNEKPGFAVRVGVDHPDRTYWAGQELKASVLVSKDAYVYLFYQSASGEVHCVFPNSVQQENFVRAGEEVQIPAAGAEFRFRVTPPYGRELLKVVATLRKIEPGKLGVQSFTQKSVTRVNPNDVKGLVVELKRDPGGWAEHEVEVLTSDREVQKPSQRRVGVFVGISRFADSRIRALKVSDKDAIVVAEVMQRQCKFDKTLVLANEQATLENIHKAICQDLVEATNPGDLVVIFWSGHGGRCADDNGDEKDGYDEYMVPHDGRLDDLDTIRRTMLLDDTFGRWLQNLDGRKIVVVLDTCYSGGQHEGAKGIEQPGLAPSGDFDFLDGDMDSHTKDIGQKETAMLASAKPSQVAMERREADLSVMTYFLVKRLMTSEGSVSLKSAFDYLQAEVPAYVQGRFPGMTQDPVLIDHTTPPLDLRP